MDQCAAEHVPWARSPPRADPLGFGTGPLFRAANATHHAAQPASSAFEQLAIGLGDWDRCCPQHRDSKAGGEVGNRRSQFRRERPQPLFASSRVKAPEQPRRGIGALTAPGHGSPRPQPPVSRKSTHLGAATVCRWRSPPRALLPPARLPVRLPMEANHGRHGPTRRHAAIRIGCATGIKPRGRCDVPKNTRRHRGPPNSPRLWPATSWAVPRPGRAAHPPAAFQPQTGGPGGGPPWVFAGVV